MPDRLAIIFDGQDLDKVLRDLNVRYNARTGEGQSGGRHHDWSGSEFNAVNLQGSLVEK